MSLAGWKTEMNRATPTINEVFDEFLAAQRQRLSVSSADRYEDIVGLFQSCMDGYGHQWLSDEEAKLFQREYNRNEEQGSFCNLFGPERILENLDDFLGWFLIRKTMASKSTLEATPTVLRKLVDWLVERDFVSRDAADGASELLDQAGSLAKAEAFSSQLYELMEEGSVLDVTESQDWENEMAVITRVEKGTIWLQNEETDYEVAFEVPDELAALAEPGWRISALHLGRTSEGWHLLEMGNVYPI